MAVIVLACKPGILGLSSVKGISILGVAVHWKGVYIPAYQASGGIEKRMRRKLRELRNWICWLRKIVGRAMVGVQLEAEGGD